MKIALLTLLIRHSRRVCRAQADEAAIRENVKQMESGWNTKSGALFAKAFAEDADYVVINGIYIKGRKAIETTHQQGWTIAAFQNTAVVSR